VFGLHQRAVQIGQELKAENFQILNDIVLNQVLVACDSDQITDLTMRYIQESGDCWVGGASWNGKTVIRISICSWATTEDDITRCVSTFVSARNKAIQESSNR
jgi:threonine aldolase